MAERVHVLATDLDGTLLRSDLSVSAPNQAAVADCLQQGIHVVLATGRTYGSTVRFAELWPDHQLWIAACNGAVLRRADGSVTLREMLLPVETAREIAVWAQEQGLYLKTYIDDHLIVARVTEETLRFSREHGVPFDVVPDIAGAIHKGPTKMVLIDHPERIPQLERVVRERWSEVVEITASTPDGLEFTAVGVSKATALALLVEHLGTDFGQVAAIGNERNDLSMISKAGFGGVVANSPPAVRSAAPQVFRANDADGVAEFIKAWLAQGR